MSLHENARDQLMDFLVNNDSSINVPSEVALSAQLKVSRTTIRRALQDLADWNVVSRIPKRGTFINPRSEWHVPNDQPLSRDRKIVALILPAIHNAFDRRLVAGFLYGAEECGEDVVVRLSRQDPLHESRIIREAEEQGYQGLAVFPCENEMINAELMKKNLERFPLVLLDRWFPGIPFNSVRTDNYKAGVLAAEWLLKKGFRSLSIIARYYGEPGGTETVRERIKGIEDTLIRHGMHVLRDAYCFGLHLSAEEFQTRVETCILNNGKVDAVITVRPSDAILLNSILLKAPSRKLGRVTFDTWQDYESLCPEPAPPDAQPDGEFPWIDQSEWEMGRMAAKMLNDVINHPQKQFNQVLPVVLRPHQNASPEGTPIFFN